jgi:Family of unknown function (DUF6516)
VPFSDVELLSQSAMVRRIIFVSFDGIADSYILKVRTELKNGWLMDYWEHRNPELNRYSFHVFQGDQMIVRWDSVPQHLSVATLPFHKHLGQEIEDSEEMDVEKVM